MLFSSHAKAVNRRHRRAMCSMCVGRAVRCACVAPKPKAQVFSVTGRVCSRKRTAHRAPASACAAVVDKAHGGLIDVASAPCQPSAAFLCRPSPRPRWLSIDATGARWAVCAWGVLCDAAISCVAPEPTPRRRLFSLAGRIKQKTTAHKSTRVSTKHAAVSSMLHLHPAYPPPHYFAGLRRGLASAWPRHKGLPLVRDSCNGVVCGVYL